MEDLTISKLFVPYEESYNNYEEAELVCLKKLIEIVKKQE